jgi:predicted glycoside hydrolase/deacetylase ChbG (UPF0249 family)
LTPYLVVNADDFGITEGTNRAILDAFQNGIVTSTSLLANGEAFDHAVGLAHENPSLGVGVHLTLSEGRAVDDLNRMGAFLPELKAGMLPLGNRPFVAALMRGRLPRKKILREFKAQTQKIIIAGIKPTHIDGHKYIHLLPGIASIAAEVAEAYSIPFIRLPRPADSLISRRPMRLPGLFALAGMSAFAYPFARMKNLRRATRYLGFIDTGHLTIDILRTMLKTPRAGITELVCHPAYRSIHLQTLLQRGYAWIGEYEFENETAAVSSTELRRELESAGWKLVNFGQIPD